MSDTKTIMTGIVCPLLGVIICNSMALAPVPALLEARKTKSLGDLSPIPFAMMCNSQLGWTLYGIMKRDYFIFFSSGIPLVICFIMSLTAIHILERGEYTSKEETLRMTIERILVGSTCFWLTMGFITGVPMGTSDMKDNAVIIIGSFSVVSSFVFYAAPLANMREIIGTKDSSMLYWPALVMNLFNCLLWFFYGLLGVYSVMIWFPNIVGGAITSVEIMMCVIYPAKHKDLSHKDKGVEPPNTDFSVYYTSRKMSLDYSEHILRAQRRNSVSTSSFPRMGRQGSRGSSVDSMTGIQSSYSSKILQPSGSTDKLMPSSYSSSGSLSSINKSESVGTMTTMISNHQHKDS